MTYYILHITEFAMISIGTQEQSYIGNLMMYAACLGENTELCDVMPMTTVDPMPDRDSQTILVATPSLVFALLMTSWQIHA